MRFLLRFWLLMPVPLLLCQSLQYQGMTFQEQSMAWLCLTPALLVLYSMQRDRQEARKEWQQQRNRLLAGEFLLDPASKQDRAHAAKLKLGESA